MRTRLLVTFCLLGLGCSSAMRTPGGGTGGEEETGGASGDTGGNGGSKTGGSGGSSKTGGSGGGSDTGGSGGSATGGSGGSATGGSGGTQTGGSGGSTGGSGGATGGSGGTGTGGTGAGGSTGGCAGAKFCDDFEGAGMPGAFTMGAGITIDTTKARSGTKALHFKVGGASFVTFTKQFPVNDLYGRLMLYMANPPTSGSHWDFIRSDTTVVRLNGKAPQWSIGGQFGKFELVCDPPDNGLDSNTPFPGNKWVCIQWHYGFDPNGNKTTFLAQVDGMPVDKGMFTGPKGTDWQASAWKDLQIGWELFGSGGAPEFWVDDLAFGEQPIPCPGP